MPRNRENWNRLRREWYARNPDKQKALVRKRTVRVRVELRTWVNSLKAEKGCEDCSERDPICLDFHHLRDKVICIGKAVARTWSKERLEKEMAKCVVLCANCHRKRHSLRPRR